MVCIPYQRVLRCDPMKKFIFVGMVVIGLAWGFSASETAQAQRQKEQMDVIIAQVKQGASEGAQKPAPSATPCTMHVTQFHLFNPEFIGKVLDLLRPGK